MGISKTPFFHSWLHFGFSLFGVGASGATTRHRWGSADPRCPSPGRYRPQHQRRAPSLLQLVPVTAVRKSWGRREDSSAPLLSSPASPMQTLWSGGLRVLHTLSTWPRCGSPHPSACPPSCRGAPVSSGELFCILSVF